MNLIEAGTGAIPKYNEHLARPFNQARWRSSALNGKGSAVENRLQASLHHLLHLSAVALFATSLEAAISVSLTSSLRTPQPVGTTVTWTATATDSDAGTKEYQFSVRLDSGSMQIVRDFHTTPSFQWTPSVAEGAYTIQVVAANTATGQTTQTSQTFTATSRLNGGLAAVNPTAHPLVALFSVPPCAAGNSTRVRFHLSGWTVSQTTNSVACNPAKSANFYIAGMYANSQYFMRYEILSSTGTVIRSGAELSFVTGAIPSTITIPPTSVLVPPQAPTASLAPVLLHDYLPAQGSTFVPVATDLYGSVLWYYPRPVSLLTRTEPGGKMLVIYAGNTNPYQQLLREIDLAGNTTLETNVNRINEQLMATGKRTINAFHHEARRLPNGDIAVLGSDEMLTESAQGGTPGHPVDVLGAQILILDSNLQLKWAWDAFDYLDIHRTAPLNEVCTPGHTGCPVFRLASQANDWLHANSIQLAPDGNLVASLRHADWVIKINYANGVGDGHVMWRMGYQGDFTLANPPSSPLCTTPDQKDAFQWFSHQHDANFQLGGNIVLSVYDNGNLRRARCDTDGNSRGYVLHVDETHLRATPSVIADLGGYSLGLGTAELIPGSGRYHFESGWMPGPTSVSTEVDQMGTTIFKMRADNVTTYRSYRMRDLYTPAQ